ncbi:MAG: fibronectin type III domain-containing protein [Kiritimatiellae bacterium]|nr:fibronectin type III domain-containing protein [Kiritimatiellia bacterium]MBQ6341420.1 fibronectin type III domain-containing protein [Kiritimatiellia bacterium]
MNRLALPLLFLPALAQASFLGDLAANPNVVSSSPYATGGDLVLKLGEAEYVHVFTNTAAAAAFTPAQALKARILVVGGGGSGGGANNSGGGHAGGFVEGIYALSANTDYTVKIGAGGAATTYYLGTNAGKESSFGGNLISAGGGAGGRNSGDNSTSNSGSPQLNAGGNANCGGGGGAGGAGLSGFAGIDFGVRGGWGGRGGPGIESDITGEKIEYASGGNGGAGSIYFDTPAQGNGGAGRTANGDGKSGENGTGSGGGSYNGAGGSGIVIVRYETWASAVPLVADASAVAGGPSHARVSARLVSSGSADSATLFVHVRQSGASTWGADKEIGAVSGAAINRTVSSLIGGLDAGATYEWEIWASNTQGDSAALAGTFTTLAADALATGGTVSTVGLRRIHTFMSDGTFVLPAETVVDYLVVGGGGSGGNGDCGGGGGGGQVIYRTAVSLPAGSYPVAIGAGGTSIDVANNAVWGKVSSEATAAAAAGAMGGDSTFNGETAHGGGPGGAGSGYNARILTGWFRGASGGGASKGLGHPSIGGLSAYWDAGHNGGSDGSGNKYGSGGGGAGGAGAGSTSSAAGDGGSGFACAITGETVYYGAGGGGATSQKTGFGAGGSGVGGDGGHAYDKTVDASEVAARNGKDGAANTGSGGGGAYSSDYNKTTYTGGTGADGVVIVSYVDYSLVSGGTAPVVENPAGLVAEANAATFTVNVIDAGGGDGTVTLMAHYGYDAASMNKTQLLAADVIGSTACKLTGLVPGTAYSFYVTADNGETGGTTDSEVVSFTTAPMFSESLAYTAAGGVLGFTVDGAATADSQRLELWVGADAASMTNQATYTDASLLAAGAHTIQPFAAEQFGTDAAILLRHISVVDGIAFTNDTAVLSTTLADGATYTWKSDVAEGDWCDAANWTASTTPGRGWPTAGSIAKFPAMTATCRVDRAVSVATLSLADKGDYSFAGTADDAAITAGAVDYSTSKTGTIRLSALAFTQTGMASGVPYVAQSFVLENGASFRYTNNNNWWRPYKGSYYVGEDCLFQVGNFTDRAGATSFTIDGGTVSCSLFEFSDEDRASMDLVLSGAASRLRTSGGFYANKQPATVTIGLAGTYSKTEALIVETGSTKMAASGATITFEAPKTAASKNLGKCDILVADWTRSSINTSLVEFGEVDRDGSYFYFTEAADSTGTRYKSAAEVTAASATAKCIWYHHAPPGATVLILK